jgi:hypothetical protein
VIGHKGGKETHLVNWRSEVALERVKPPSPQIREHDKRFLEGPKKQKTSLMPTHYLYYYLRAFALCPQES